MTNIEIRVNGASAVKVKQEGLLTAGMVGATATFAFDSAWAGLTKTAVFRCGGLVRDVIGVENSARIPTEVLCADADLYVGVEGRSSDGSVVIPTVWVRAAYVYPGANASGDPSVDSELPVWAQIQGAQGDLSKLDTVDKSSLVAAINEVLRSGGGTVDEDAIARLVEEYLAENPPAQGEPGVSATHSWDGTVLTITSASGTSSADLKGEPGKDGEDGADGSPGKDGEDGKSAYQYAQDAGYGGTEEEFARDLAEDAPSGGSKEWRLLHNVELTEEVAANSGMMFDTTGCKEIIVRWICPKIANAVGFAVFKINGELTDNGGPFWNNKLCRTTAATDRSFRFEALGDSVVLSPLWIDGDTHAAWWNGEGMFNTIDTLQLVHYGGTYPIGLKIIIWGR